mgnify:CR=1 FL=1
MTTIGRFIQKQKIRKRQKYAGKESALAQPLAELGAVGDEFHPRGAGQTTDFAIPGVDRLHEGQQVSDPLLRGNVYASARLPLDQIDQCPEDTLNRILWHAMKGPQAPYPAWAVWIQEDDD